MAITNVHYILQKAAETIEAAKRTTNEVEKIRYNGMLQVYKELYRDGFDREEKDRDTREIAFLIFTMHETYDTACARIMKNKEVWNKV